MSEVYQVHLASKVVVPASEKTVDGKVIKTPERTVTIRGMSNRVVRYRAPLSPDEITKAYDEAAVMVGEDGTRRQFSVLGQMYTCYAFVTEYSEPTDDPMNPKLTWKKLNVADCMKSPEAWSSIFTAKDTTFLQKQYTEWHDMTAEEVNLLSGKAIPVAS